MDTYGWSFFNDNTYEQTICRLRKDLDTCTMHLENELRLAQQRDTEQARYTKQLSDGMDKLVETNAFLSEDKIFWKNVSVALLAIFFIALILGFYTKLHQDIGHDHMMLDNSGCLLPNYSVKNGDEEFRILKIKLAQTREMLAQTRESMAKKDLANERNHQQLLT